MKYHEISPFLETPKYCIIHYTTDVTENDDTDDTIKMETMKWNKIMINPWLYHLMIPNHGLSWDLMDSLRLINTCGINTTWWILLIPFNLIMGS